MPGNSELECVVDLNKHIFELLSQAEIDFSALNSLVEKREISIIKYLETLDSQNRKAFASQELETQKAFESAIQEHLSVSKNDLSKFLSARKQVAKYK